MDCILLKNPRFINETLVSFLHLSFNVMLFMAEFAHGNDGEAKLLWICEIVNDVDKDDGLKEFAILSV